jgi:hypothetical protein
LPLPPSVGDEGGEDGGDAVGGEVADIAEGVINGTPASESAIVLLSKCSLIGKKLPLSFKSPSICSLLKD